VASLWYLWLVIMQNKDMREILASLKDSLIQKWRKWRRQRRRQGRCNRRQQQEAAARSGVQATRSGVPSAHDTSTSRLMHVDVHNPSIEVTPAEAPAGKTKITNTNWSIQF
jgi:hypothetical protein